MRIAFLVLAILWLVCAYPASASIVIHDGQPGIVATSRDGYVLDNEGRCWGLTNGGEGGWGRIEALDVTIPIDSIKFWMANYLISMNNEGWVIYNGQWTNFGPCPGLSAVPESTTAAVSAPLKMLPNPSGGPCRVSFSVPLSGPVTAQLFDVSGRLVRELLRGEHSAGEYAPIWDGKDDAGRDVAAGIYLVKVTTTAGESTGRVVLAK